MTDGSTNKRALIIGSSLAALFTARVLSDHYDHITLIERDTLPQTPDHRAGVPQSQHAHGLLARGQQIIESHFPGIMSEMSEHGAAVGDVDDLCIVTPEGKLASTPAGEDGIFVSRYFLEWSIRERLKASHRVEIVDETQATRLLASNDGTSIVGVETRTRGGETQIQQHFADLVVDATGRHSKTPRWLTELGYEAPPEETINSGVGYFSRFYKRPDHFPADWQGVIINARPPHTPYCGLILPIEGDRWHVTLGNFAGQYPDTDWATSDEGFMAIAQELADPSLYEALRIAEPITSVRAYRTPVNHFRHYENLEQMPKNFLVVGDAICAFNPIYGQGMSTSAMGSLVLAEALNDRRPGWERAFQQNLAKTVATPWFIATSEDMRWSNVQLEGAVRNQWVGRIMRGYVSRLLRAARHDEQLALAYTRLLNLLEKPSYLMRPSMMARVAVYMLQEKLGLRHDDHELALSPMMIASLRARTATPVR